MKKLILSACLLLGTFSLFAQDSSNNMNNTNAPVNNTNVQDNNTNLPANNTNATVNMNMPSNSGTAPDNIRMSFQSTYPDATNVTWETVTLPVFSQYWRTDLGPVKWYTPMQGYRASYVANNRIMRVYYTDRGKTYMSAGPVIESWVPEEVVTKVITQYGSNVYDVTMMKNSAKMDVYQVRYSENGNLATAYINADGSAATSSDVIVLK